MKFKYNISIEFTKNGFKFIIRDSSDKLYFHSLNSGIPLWTKYKKSARQFKSTKSAHNFIFKYLNQDKIK